jgi:hypothetical protein
MLEQRRRSLPIGESEETPRVGSGAVIEDVIRDPRSGPVGVVWIEAQDVDSSVGVTGRERLSHSAKKTPRSPNQIPQGSFRYLASKTVARVLSIEPRRQRAIDLEILAFLGFLEYFLQASPGAPQQWNPLDDLQELRPCMRAALSPEREDDLMQSETIRKRVLGIGRLEDLHPLLPNGRSLLRRFALERERLHLSLELLPGERPLSWRFVWSRIVLLGELDHEVGQVGIASGPGASHIFEVECALHENLPQRDRASQIVMCLVIA